jgi:hypothetical protein
MFETLGYEIVKGAISKETSKLLSIEFNLLRDSIYISNNINLNAVGYNNDDQVEESFAQYGALCFESLMVYLHPLMEEVTGKKLFPCYSYARIYYPGATMTEHTDRPSCQYSATITIDYEGTEPWEIWFEDAKGSVKPLYLDIGDVCVYKGTELRHWRDEFKGTKQIQAFIHFVDADGEYADYKYDHREALGLSKF